MTDWLKPLALLLLFAVVFVWPSLRVWRQSGLNPYRFGSGDDANALLGASYRASLIGFMVLAVLQAALGELPIWLGAWPRTGSMEMAGWLLYVAALGWLVIAQRQMGQSWRIGLDAELGALVTHGVFARSRNPVFLGMRLLLLTLLLWLPAWATLCLAIVAELTMQLQVRLEEAALAARWGQPYVLYRQRTPRWL